MGFTVDDWLMSSEQIQQSMNLNPEVSPKALWETANPQVLGRNIFVEHLFFAQRIRFIQFYLFELTQNMIHCV